jgi:hypothetical protein
MDTAVGSAAKTVYAANIAGQSTQTIRWILRGDELGSYSLGASYNGILDEFNLPISAQFNAPDAIEVQGLTGVTARVDVSDYLGYNNGLCYNLSLINNSDRDIYLPNIWTRWGEYDGDLGYEVQSVELGAEFFDAAGTALSEADETGRNYIMQGVSTIFTGTIQVLKPGEKIVRHYYAGSERDKGKLQDYFYRMLTDGYGLTVEIVPRDPAYFDS